MQVLSRNGGRLVAGLLAGAALATLGTAAPASAQSGFVSIKPKVAPNLDVAQGASFPLVARDSSGISFAESWKFVPASSGHVLILNRHFKDGTTEMAMDVQDTSTPGSPSDPGPGKAVGTSPRDGSLSQQWKVVPVAGSGTSVLINRHSERKLSFAGTGFTPAYVQSDVGLTEFIITPLG